MDDDFNTFEHIFQCYGVADIDDMKIVYARRRPIDDVDSSHGMSPLKATSTSCLPDSTRGAEHSDTSRKFANVCH